MKKPSHLNEIIRNMPSVPILGPLTPVKFAMEADEYPELKWWLYFPRRYRHDLIWIHTRVLRRGYEKWKYPFMEISFVQKHGLYKARYYPLDDNRYHLYRGTNKIFVCNKLSDIVEYLRSCDLLAK